MNSNSTNDKGILAAIHELARAIILLAASGNEMSDAIRGLPGWRDRG